MKIWDGIKKDGGKLGEKWNAGEKWLESNEEPDQSSFQREGGIIFIRFFIDATACT